MQQSTLLVPNNVHLNKASLPAKPPVPKSTFFIKLFGNPSYPAQTTFYFNQTLLTQ